MTGPDIFLIRSNDAFADCPCAVFDNPTIILVPITRPGGPEKAGVLNTDIAERGAAVRVKALTTVLVKNAGLSTVLVVGFAKKLY
jgi:hypothetical protein